jgi:hypothetical protein
MVKIAILSSQFVLMLMYLVANSYHAITDSSLLIT